MSDDSDFFGDVFDDPEDDPLLEGDETSSGGASEEPERQQGPPSWMEEPHTNGEAHSDHEGENGMTKQREIVVDQSKEETNGIDALNQAVGQGWRLVRLSLARPDGEQAASSQEAHRFVAILEQDRPQSLFDFG